MKEKIELPRWLLVGLGGGAGLFLTLPIYTLFAWNLCIPHIFGLPTMDFGNALGFDLFALPFLAIALLKIRVDD